MSRAAGQDAPERPRGYAADGGASPRDLPGAPRRPGHATLARLVGVRRLATAAGAVVALSADAWACPYCALSQGVETLVFIMAFLAIPYIVVSAVMIWMKRVMAREREELAAAGEVATTTDAAGGS